MPYKVKDSSDFNLDVLLTSGIVKRSYWIIPGKFSVTFRTLLTKEASELRDRLIAEKGDKMNLFSFNFEFMLNQLVDINGEKISSPEEAREKLGRLASNITDRIQDCYNQFVNEVNSLMEQEVSDGSENQG